MGSVTQETLEAAHKPNDVRQISENHEINLLVIPVAEDDHEKDGVTI